jgi:hypothetical protein
MKKMNKEDVIDRLTNGLPPQHRVLVSITLSGMIELFNDLVDLADSQRELIERLDEDRHQHLKDKELMMDDHEKLLKTMLEQKIQVYTHGMYHLN